MLHTIQVLELKAKKNSEKKLKVERKTQQEANVKRKEQDRKRARGEEGEEEDDTNDDVIEGPATVISHTL
jgi:hypothetical protein